MFDELFKQIVVQSPIAGVLLFALWIVYNDLKKNQETARTERQELLDVILDLKSRTKTIEQATTGDVSPTLPKRPDGI